MDRLDIRKPKVRLATQQWALEVQFPKPNIDDFVLINKTAEASDADHLEKVIQDFAPLNEKDLSWFNIFNSLDRDFEKQSRFFSKKNPQPGDSTTVVFFMGAMGSSSGMTKELENFRLAYPYAKVFCVRPVKVENQLKKICDETYQVNKDKFVLEQAAKLAGDICKPRSDFTPVNA